MAGFGVGPTDIVNAIGLAWNIWNTYFDEQNVPDSQYTLFGAEIRTFRGLLTRFVDTFDRAARAYQEQPRLALSDHSPLLNPQHDILENERKSVIGNAEKTLEECETILANCTARNGSRLVMSFTWTVSTKKRVAGLRDRLQFHMLKIQLLMELYNGGLRQDDAEQLTRVEEIVGDLHAVQFQGIPPQQTRSLAKTPEAVQRRFMAALVTGAPDSSHSEQQLPLEEGFDALTYHFGQSTVQTRGFPGPTQSVEQYINLLKARWLSGLLKANPQYESSFYYRRLTLKLDHAIRREFSRNDLTVYEEHELASAPATAFTIWKPSTLEPVPVNFGIDEREVTLLELVLAGTQQTLIVNRISDTELRLVKSSVTRTNGEIVREREEHIPINIHAHHFEPAYANPTLPETVPRVVISGSLVHSACVYDLDNMKNVFDLQQAFTGFRVVCDMENVDCSYDRKKSLFVREVEPNRARLQIWQHKPLTKAKTSCNPATSPSNRSISSSAMSAASSMTTAERMVTHLNPSIVAVDPETQVVTLRRHVLPVLVFYTTTRRQQDSRRMLFHVQLVSSIQVNRNRCKCRQANTCLRVVLERNTGGKLGVLALTEEGYQQWDLAVLGLPRHPQFKERMLPLDCHYLALDFKTLDEKTKFLKDFRYISALRDKGIKDYQQARETLLWRSNQANHQEFAADRDGPPAEVSIAPALDEMDFGQAFEDSMSDVRNIQ